MNDDLDNLLKASRFVGSSLEGLARANEFNVEAILFDVDGTLVDSTAAVERTWRAWAAEWEVEAEEILAVCHGRRSEDTIASFVKPEHVSTATRELEELELNDLEGVVALPSARRLLSELPSARWAAVTSGSRALMRARLEAAGLPTPEVFITADDVAVGKPDPEGYLAAAARLGFAPFRCLVVEDAPAGIDAGRSSGATVIAVETSHDSSQLRSADYVIADLRFLDINRRRNGLVATVNRPRPS